MELTVRFIDTGSTIAAAVGGKGANLGVLAHAKFPVPDGFTVTTTAYTQFLAEGGMAETVQGIVGQIDFGDATAVDKRTAEIRALLEGAAMPAPIADAIRSRYAELGAQTRVAVRSSGTAEDLAGASFAGQHDTYLHIRGAEGVIDAVKRCWASLWTARATAYRAHKGFAQDEVGIAVVVQTMVDSEVAGVMFTANPIAGLTSEIGIDASWGLGEAVVSGLVTPDSFLLDRITLEVKNRTLGTKEQRIRLDDAAGAGTVHEEVPATQRDAYCLTDAQLSELGELGLRVTAHYDEIPQDTEWALADGKFYLLQARPVTGTVLSWDEDVEYWQQGPDDSSMMWSRAMSDDGWTGAVTPLFYSIRARSFSEWYWRDNALAGLPELAGRRWQKYHRGTVYWSTESFDLWNSRYVPSSVRPAMLANTDPLKREEILSAPNSYLALAKLFLRMQIVDPRHGVTSWVKVQDDYIYNRRIEAAGQSDEAILAMTDRQLMTYIDERVRWEIDYIKDICLGYVLHWIAAGQALAAAIMKWYSGPNAAGALMDLLTGSEKPTVTAVENLQLWHLSRTIYDSPELTALFRAHPGAEFFAQLDTLEGGRKFKAAYDAFVAEYGPRGHADRDIYFIRRVEDPAVDYRMLAAFLEVDPSHDPEVMEHAAQARKAAAAADIEANLRAQPLGFLKAEIFKLLNAYNQKLLTERDNQRGFVDIATFAYKRPLTELNRRAMERGLFDDDRDYFFLAQQELFDVFTGKANMTLTRAKIAGRKHNFDLVNNKDRTNPMYLRNGREVVLDDGADAGLRGIPTSGGTATGIARVVKNLDEIGKVKQGEIMICNSTDPGWTPVFLLLAGAVFETGGAFAHCSCISREYGIPAIQVPGALHKIPDGATITIDGNTGAITLHDEADAAVDA
jgi:pyruvate,water dikinase